MNEGDVAAGREELRARQLARLNALWGRVLPENEFYARKLGKSPFPLSSLEELAALPLTTKAELVAGADASGRAPNHTWPPERYLRWHQTSGTHGRPLVICDTAEDWQWWLAGWQTVLDAAEVTARDVVLLAFSFGPFIGFWSACDAALARGCLVVPGGGLSSLARLELLRASSATCLCCTPSYALHLAEVAAEQQFDLAALPVRRIIVAGEPGGSLPAVRNRLETLWHAHVIDHAGATEVGPWGYAMPDGAGLVVNEAEFIAEFLPVEGPHASADPTLRELVLTNLGRPGCPVLRYRTGDLVRPQLASSSRTPDPRPLTPDFITLPGGIVGRVDDMLIVRGVNIFPSAIDDIVRSFPAVSEYRVVVARRGALDELELEIEAADATSLTAASSLAAACQTRLGLSVIVRIVPAGTLPRTQGKARRIVDHRIVDHRIV